MTTVDRKSSYKLEFIKKIEESRQANWEEKGYFRVDALPKGSENHDSQKYFVTFPYPYMNGRLHLGHAFSLSKCEFAVGYQRLKGKRCLFPFGLHCTGMPIKACADKLKVELEKFGLNKQQNGDAVGCRPPAEPGSQWNVMRSFGLSDDEVVKFVDPLHWIYYFSPLAISDVKSLGAKIDERRSFVTTDLNPFYDSFVRWQFLRLKERNCLLFGKRYTIYSPKDGQPCMDHDRQCGEGALPQEFVGIKMQVVEDKYGVFENVKGGKVFVVASTLRPETTYGVTNCYVNPDMEYIVFESRRQGEYYVTSEHAARNMCYQGIAKLDDCYDVVCRVVGSQLIGCKLRTPFSAYEHVFILPMMRILECKGTGLVMSVPSDSVDDYAALNDIREKPQLRKKYDISDHMVFPFKEVPIVDVPPYGSLCALSIYKEMKITSQNDAVLLNEAKEKIMKNSYYNGKMLVGEFAGTPVTEAKKVMKERLINNGDAFLYMEPERKVVSRSANVCVVALCDQWYISYDKEDWKNKVREVVSRLETYSEEVKNNFYSTLDWLREHACSRQYGLGTKMPWDNNYLIESLSDSTIYMAYYTVAHFLQGGSLDGRSGNKYNITAEQMTPAVWDYIFFKEAVLPEDSTICRDILRNMKNEFEYWYPFNLRVSGKDLIPNHLTYCLYNHVAMWDKEPERWPVAFRGNGYLMLNSEKMSKSTGNFFTIREAVDQFGADATRFGLADAGDTIEDANFTVKCAEAALLKLYNFIVWCEEMTCSDSLRVGPTSLFCDRFFKNELDRAVVVAQKCYDSLMFRDALKSGFFDLLSSRDLYLELSLQSPHRDLIHRYMEVQSILLAPICPHVSDHIYGLIGKGSVMEASWPDVSSFDDRMFQCSKYLIQLVAGFRARFKLFKESKAGKTRLPDLPVTATVYVAENFASWQTEVLDVLTELFNNNFGIFPENKEILKELRNRTSVAAEKNQRVMAFMNHYKTKAASDGLSSLNSGSLVDEKQILSENMDYIKKTLTLADVVVLSSSQGPKQAVDEALPMSPVIIFQ